MLDFARLQVHRALGCKAMGPAVAWIIVLALGGCGADLEGSELPLPAQASLLETDSETSTFELTIVDSNHSANATLLEALPIKSAAPHLRIERDEAGELVGFEIVDGPIKGIFSQLTYNDEQQGYDLRGLGFIDVGKLLLASEPAIQEAGDPAMELELCSEGSSAPQQSTTIAQFQLHLSFEGLDGKPVLEFNDAAQIVVEFQVYTLHTRQICGVSVPKTEVQLELSGGFRSPV